MAARELQLLFINKGRGFESRWHEAIENEGSYLHSML